MGNLDGECLQLVPRLGCKTLLRLMSGIPDRTGEGYWVKNENLSDRAMNYRRNLELTASFMELRREDGVHVTKQ